MTDPEAQKPTDPDPQHWLQGIRRMKDKRKIERDITKQKMRQSYTQSKNRQENPRTTT
jgi:hypothetical protein